MSFLKNNFKDGGFELTYIQYLVEKDQDFTAEEMKAYEDFYDGDVPQVTYMPYVFMMQDAYAERQKKEIEKAKEFSAVFIPIDNFIMKYLSEKSNGKKFIENDSEKTTISKLNGFLKLDTAFNAVAGKNFFDYIKRPSSEGPSTRSNTVSTKPNKTVSDTSANFKQLIDRRVADSIRRPPLLENEGIDHQDTVHQDTVHQDTVTEYEKNRFASSGQTAGGGHRRSHKPSQKKTSKGKSRSRSRSRSRSKTRSKSKSKSKTRAKSKSKRR
jgi:hypothetical protein